MKQVIIISWVVMFLSTQLIGQEADFGDAPDNVWWWSGIAEFPTLDVSIGPKHTLASTSTFWIGTTRPNTTTMEWDANVVDNDFDDGRPPMLIYLIGIPAAAKLKVPISTSPNHNPDQVIYINVAIDVDNDLDFDDWNSFGQIDDNWIIENSTRQLPADTTMRFEYGPFGFGSDHLLLPVWLRVTLTDVPINSPWLGQGIQGGWTVGETEDWMYNGRRRGQGGGGGGGNPPGNPPPVPPPWPGGFDDDEKCLEIKHPGHIYVECEEEVEFTITLINCGKKDIELPIPPYGAAFWFQHIDGVPLAQGPEVIDHFPNPPAKAIRFKCRAVGWDCDGEEDRFSKYRIHVTYDPNNIYDRQYLDLTFRSYEFPWEDSLDLWYVAAEFLNDSLDQSPWWGKVDSSMSHGLVAWTGYINTWNNMRWIQGQPIISPIYMPTWATFNTDSLNADSTFYSFTGTPGIFDNGIDSAVFMVQSDDMILDSIIIPWKIKVPIYIENIDNKPTFTSTLADSITIDINQNDSIYHVFIASDPDLDMGKEDTLFFDYLLYNLSNDSLYWPQSTLTFEENGDRSASFKWIPDQGDLGSYKLVFICWDYYSEFDSTETIIEVVDAVDVNDEGLLSDYHLYQNVQNPFTDKTTIKYEIPDKTHVILNVYSMNGHLVSNLVNEVKSPGIHSVIWDASGLNPGIYLYRIHAGNFHSVKKCLLIRK
jgi:hypothetical protein